MSLCFAITRAENPVVRLLPDYGRGEAGQFRVAMITDLHIGHTNTSSWEDWWQTPPGDYDYGDPCWYGAFSGSESTFAQYLRNSVSWINGHRQEQNIKLVVVTGDITQSAELAEFQKAKSILDSLEIPYVPIPGNHDLWPYARGVDEAPKTYNWVGPDRYFDSVFGSVYANLKAISDSGDSVIRNWERYPDTVWNYEQSMPYCYSLFQYLAFDAGPQGSPFHFLCMDFNSRTDGSPGVQPFADVYDLPFSNVASSVRVYGTSPYGYADFYDTTDYGGEPVRIYVSDEPVNLDDYDLNDKLSSVKLGSAPGCTLVNLWEDENGQGRKFRVDRKLDATGDRDLRENGPYCWPNSGHFLFSFREMGSVPSLNELEYGLVFGIGQCFC